MTEPQTQAHWSDLYRRYIDEGTFEIRRAEMQQAWAALAPLFLDPLHRVLEVGCGVGLFLEYLIAHGHREWFVKGVDLSEVAVNIARERIPLGEFQVCNVAEEPLPWQDGHFDIAFSGHTIEHVADPVVMLREMRRVTREGGAIIIEFPHGDPPYVEHIHHDLTYDVVTAWMREAGIEIVTCMPVVEMRPTDDGVIVGRRPA